MVLSFLGDLGVLGVRFWSSSVNIERPFTHSTRLRLAEGSLSPFTWGTGLLCGLPGRGFEAVTIEDFASFLTGEELQIIVGRVVARGVLG
jgi:hypothetical protein